MLRSLVIQAVIFLLAFQALSYFREASMLSKNLELSAFDQNITHNVATLMGEPVNLAAQGKTTVIYFFAPWCKICHVSIGNLQALYEKNDQLEVIAVALDYLSIDEVSKFTNKHQLTFPIALGNEAIKQVFSISGYPSYYVIDEENTIVGKSMGYSSELGLYLRAL